MPGIRLWSPVQLSVPWSSFLEEGPLAQCAKVLSDDVPDNAMPLIMTSVWRGYSSLLRYLNAHFILFVISCALWQSSPVQQLSSVALTGSPPGTA